MDNYNPYETIINSSGTGVDGFIKSSAPPYKQTQSIITATTAIDESEIKRIEARNGVSGYYDVDSNSDLLMFSSKQDNGNNKIDFDGLLENNNRAGVMGISRNIRDYAFVVCLGFITDMVNSNGISLPYSELNKNVDPYKKQVETWIGSPIYLEHDNKDLTKSRGMIVDTRMVPLEGYPNYYKVMMLLAICSKKDPDFYRAIVIDKIRNGYSIGATTPGYKCSYCDTFWKAGAPSSNCEHMDSRRVNYYVHNGRLYYAEATRPKGFEISSVRDPAFAYSITDQFLQPVGDKKYYHSK